MCHFFSFYHMQCILTLSVIDYNRIEAWQHGMDRLNTSFLLQIKRQFNASCPWPASKPSYLGERTSRARTRERAAKLSPLLSRASRASTFHDIPNGELARRLSCLVLSKQKHPPKRQNTWLKSITMTLLPCVLVLL